MLQAASFGAAGCRSDETTVHTTANHSELLWPISRVD